MISDTDRRLSRYTMDKEGIVVTHETAAAPTFSNRKYGDENSLVPARQRGLDARAQLLAAEGGTLTVREVAKRLGIVQRAVEERRRTGQLLAFPVRHIRYVYPAWQFDLRGTLPGFAETLAILDRRNPWACAAFFLARNIYLGGASPLTELRRGQVSSVLRAAQGDGEHGAS